MPKKKNSIALFEVIQKSRRSEANMEVPKWMTGSPAPTGGPTEAAPPPPAPPPTPVAAPVPQRIAPAGTRSVPAVASASAGPAAPAPAGAIGRLLAFSGNRLRVTMTYAVCAAAAGGLLVLLVAAFALGRWSGSRPEPAQQAGGPLREHVPLNKDVLGGSKLPPVGKPGAAVSTTRAKGKWFLVMQQLKGTAQAEYDEATRIADFCKKEGCPATVAKYTPAGSTKQRYIVWSLTPFDAGDSEPAKAYAHKVEEIGKAYFAKYRTYDFRQKTAGGRFDPWFEQQR